MGTNDCTFTANNHFTWFNCFRVIKQGILMLTDDAYNFISSFFQVQIVSFACKFILKSPPPSPRSLIDLVFQGNLGTSNQPSKLCALKHAFFPWRRSCEVEQTAQDSQISPRWIRSNHVTKKNWIDKNHEVSTAFFTFEESKCIAHASALKSNCWPALSFGA